VPNVGDKILVGHRVEAHLDKTSDNRIAVLTQDRQPQVSDASAGGRDAGIGAHQLISFAPPRQSMRSPHTRARHPAGPGFRCGSAEKARRAIVDFSTLPPDSTFCPRQRNIRNIAVARIGVDVARPGYRLLSCLFHPTTIVASAIAYSWVWVRVT